MSSIDNRIVEMEFDNSKFDPRIDKSTQSLDSLKKSLDLKDATKGLQDLDSASRRFSMEHMSSAVSSIADRFSALGVIGMTVLQNLANAAVNTGIQLLNGITLKPITDGFHEYETQIAAIRVMQANLGDEFDMTKVNAALDELNAYADKTIYNFGQMTEGIGKFTAAGVGLDDSVTTIKGLSNVAAGAGTSNEMLASTYRQVTQAIQRGYFQLQDWNSLVNAQMGNVEMQQNLIAMAESMGIVVDTSEGFTQSLQSGWLTAEVFTRTMALAADENTEWGARLTVAATQVDTFSKLVSTVAEAIGSGWAQSMEIIIGDYEEAVALWTAANDAISGMIGATTDARNAMLELWEAGGGRDVLLQGLKNLAEGIMSIVAPIRDALQNIFPPMTAETLIRLSEGFRDLTANIKISDEMANNIRRTFEGIFSVFDIVGQVIFAVGDAIFNLVSFLAPVQMGFWETTATIGDFVTGLSRALRESQVLYNMFDSLGSGILYIRDAISGAVSGFISWAEAVTGIDFHIPTIEEFGAMLQSIGEWFRRLVTDGGDVATTIENIKNGIGNFAAAVGAFFAPIGNAISVVWGYLKTFASWATDKLMAALNDISGADILTGVLSMGIAKGLKELVRVFKSFDISGVIDTFKEALSGIKDAIGDFQNAIKAETLMKTAKAVAILAASLVVLAMVPADQLLAAGIAISALFAELMISMKVMTKIADSKDFTGVNLLANSMIKLAAAILILAVAVNMLSDIPIDQLMNGLLALIAIILSLVITADALSKTEAKLGKAGAGIIVLAAGLLALAGVVSVLGGMDFDSMIQGLTGLGVTLLALSVFMSQMKDTKFNFSSGAGILALSKALQQIAKAVKAFGQMNLEELAKGFISLAAALTAISIFTNSTKDVGNMVAMGGGLILLSSGLLILSGVIGIMGNMSIETLAVGVLALGAALLVLAGTLNLMPNNLPVIAAGLTILSVALMLLIPTITLLGLLPLQVIITALIALGGSLLVFAMAANSLQAAVPTMLSMGIAMTLVGVGAAAMAVAISIIITAIIGLVTVVTTGGAAIIAAITALALALISLIPNIASAIAQGIINFASTIISGIGTITSAVAAVIVAVLSAVASAIPQILAIVAQLLVGVIQIIGTYGPQIILVVVQLLVNLLDALAVAMPAIVNAAINLMIGFVNGLAEGIRTHTPAVLEAVANLFSAILEFVISGLQAILGALPIVGGMIDEGLEGIKSGIRETLSPTEGQEIGQEFMDGVEAGVSEGTGVATDTVTEATVDLTSGAETQAETGGTATGQALTDSLTSSITGGIPGAENATDELMSAVMEQLNGGREEAKEAGELSADDYLGGFSGSTGEATKAGSALSGGALEGLLGNLDGFDGAGLDSGSSFISGLTGVTGDATSSGTTLSESAIEGITSKLPEFESAGSDNASAFTDAISEKSDEALAAGSEISSSAVSGASTAPAEFQSLGNDAGEGFYLGIQSWAAKAADAARQMVRNAVMAAKDEQQSASPSKVMIGLGHDFGDGYILGISAETKDVRRASTDMATAAVDGMKAVLDTIGEVVNSATLRVRGLQEEIFGVIGALNDLSKGEYGVDMNTDASDAYRERITKLISDIEAGVYDIEDEEAAERIARLKQLLIDLDSETDAAAERQSDKRTENFDRLVDDLTEQASDLENTTNYVNRAAEVRDRNMRQDMIRRNREELDAALSAVEEAAADMDLEELERSKGALEQIMRDFETGSYDLTQTELQTYSNRIDALLARIKMESEAKEAKEIADSEARMERILSELESEAKALESSVIDENAPEMDAALEEVTEHTEDLATETGKVADSTAALGGSMDDLADYIEPMKSAFKTITETILQCSSTLQNMIMEGVRYPIPNVIIPEEGFGIRTSDLEHMLGSISSGVESNKTRADSFKKQGGEKTQVIFNQTNNSPRALSRSEIYRNTSNQISAAAAYIQSVTKSKPVGVGV